MLTDHHRRQIGGAIRKSRLAGTQTDEPIGGDRPNQGSDSAGRQAGEVDAALVCRLAPLLVRALELVLVANDGRSSADAEEVDLHLVLVRAQGERRHVGFAEFEIERGTQRCAGHR